MFIYLKTRIGPPILAVVSSQIGTAVRFASSGQLSPPIALGNSTGRQSPIAQISPPSRVFFPCLLGLLLFAVQQISLAALLLVTGWALVTFALDKGTRVLEGVRQRVQLDLGRASCLGCTACTVPSSEVGWPYSASAERARAHPGATNEQTPRYGPTGDEACAKLVSPSHPPIQQGADATFDADIPSEQEIVRWVQDAMRRLHDYAYLAALPLARWHMVTQFLASRAAADSASAITHVDRGRALRQLLMQAIARLRPEGSEPGPYAVVGREWFSYLVVHDAYVLGKPNREIMSRLYIGEGTFNRIRRGTLHSVALQFREMEQTARRGSFFP